MRPERNQRVAVYRERASEFSRLLYLLGLSLQGKRADHLPVDPPRLDAHTHTQQSRCSCRPDVYFKKYEYSTTSMFVLFACPFHSYE